MTFDREYVYVSFRCWESHPERMVANEMRRDSGNVFQGDFVGFSLDTFYDRRTAVLFIVNAIGGRTDGQVSDERQYNGDWNPIWHVAVGRFDGGWTVENCRAVQVAAVPAGTRAGLGLQPATGQPVEKRDLVPHAYPDWAGHAGPTDDVVPRRRWSASRRRR